MLKNWFKIFFYNSFKNKAYTLLTVLGLAIGITGVIFSTLYWKEENSYNKWNPGRQNIFEVISVLPDGANWGFAQAPLAENIALKTGKVTASCYYTPYYIDNTFTVNNKKEYFQDILITENNFFDFFPFEFVRGSNAAFKANKYGIALEEKEALRIFGDKNPLNQTITGASGTSYPILAVYRLNKYSSLKPKYVLSSIYDNLANDEGSWGNYNYGLMLKLKSPEDAQSIINTGNEILLDNKIKAAALEEGVSTEQYLKEYGNYTLDLQSLSDARLGKKVTGFQEGKGNLLFLQIILALSILILALSVINYINLSTAQAIRRAKEIGVRKVLGASKGNIILQFVFETGITTLLSLMLALSIAEITLPLYNKLINKELEIIFSDYLPYLLTIFFTVVLFAGLFPAAYIANFEELKVLKGNFSRSRNGIWIRNGMLVIQFIIATFFISGGIIVTQQINHLAQKDLGFNADQIINIKFNGEDMGRKFDFYESFKQDLLKIKGVKEVNISTFRFGNSASSSSGFSFPNSKLSTQAQNIAFDFGFLKMLDIKLVSGRDLSPGIASDSTENVLLNQRAVRDLGGDVPLGTEFTWNGQKMKLVGIVKDFNMSSPQSEVPPMLLMHMRTVNWMQSNVNTVLIKVDPADIATTMSSIEKFWKQKINTDTPFEYDFVNRQFARSYESYVKQQKLFMVMNTVVISIALFGLFALSSYTMERRYKEIAIRKVMGAETLSLLVLLSRHYIYLAVLGFILAIVPSYLLMNSWLENFAYRIDISIWIFIATISVLLTLTLTVIMLKAFTATRINLLNYLKYE